MIDTLTSAMDIARRVRARDVSAAEVTAAALARIQAGDRAINAFLCVREAALEEARALQDRPDLQRLPLAGVPIAVKDSADVAGEPTLNGSRGAPTRPAPEDDVRVRRLREAGCIVVGKTTQPELALWPFTESVLSGVTRNPWNHERTCGGSSGGSATAVATGFVPMALGGDGGGSIRIPAACCGIFGLKPGGGIVPSGPGGGWYDLVEWGPMAARVEDAALMLDALSGTADYGGVGEPEKPLRIAVSLASPAFGVSADDETAAAIGATVRLLQEAGHRVFPADPPYPLTLALPFMQRWLEGAADEADTLAEARLEPRSRDLIRAGRWLRKWLPVRESSARPWRERMRAWMVDFDLILTPVTARAALPVGAFRGQGWVRTTLGCTTFMPYTPPWNLASWPAASVPAGMSAVGVPLGVQLVAAPGGERLLLSVALQLQRLRPWGMARDGVGLGP